MKFSQKQQEQLNKIFQENSIILAYVFGSAARERMGPLSDLDFAVLFSQEVSSEEYFDRQLKVAGDIGRIFEIDRVDIVNLATANSPLLKHNAVFGGKPIFVKDQKIQFALERKIMQEYEDTEHLREVQYFYLVKHIKEGSFGKMLPGSIKSKYLEKYVANR